MHIDINCDTGEGIGNDEALMPFITSANIACGYHAGDEETMLATIRLAQKHGVRIGAHPSFFDRENFGRTEKQTTPAEVYQLITEQVVLFKKIAGAAGVLVRHVKPHGALYNMAAKDRALANAVACAVKGVDANLILFGLSGSHSVIEAKAVGLTAWSEVFADRTYGDDGSLTPRRQPGALLENVEKVTSQVQEIARFGVVTTVSGKSLPIAVDTICLHGDGLYAVGFAQAVFATINKEE